MKSFSIFHWVLLVLISMTYPSQSASLTKFDIVVVGTTPGGIAAAVNAAKSGLKVAITSESKHIGGLTTSGLTNSDFRTFESLGGTWLEFMNRIVRHYETVYGKDSKQVKMCWKGGWYEPKVALKVFREMLAEHPNITLLLNHQLQSAQTRLVGGLKQKLYGARFLSLDKQEIVDIRGDVFIDATYEGDLLAAAGVQYRIGSEATEEYGETYAPSDRNWHVQCYNYRLTLSKDPNNMVPVSKPVNYKREEYSRILDYIRDGRITKATHIIAPFEAPNDKADFNDPHGSLFSTKVCNETDVWPEASYAVREEIAGRAKDFTLGLLYFLQNDPELPPPISDPMKLWGLPKDEYLESGHFPPLIYIREGRRMVGDYVFTEKDVSPEPNSVRVPAQKTAIAIGDYQAVSHGIYKSPDGKIEGIFSSDRGVKPPGPLPFQVPYGSLLPKTVDGLLVPVAVSSSHVGFCAIRMEPTWMALGQAAGLAAAMAIKERMEVREIHVEKLQKKLHDAGALTFYASDVSAQSPYFNAVQYLGNRGLFQQLVDPKQAFSKEKFLAPGVYWIEAFYDHYIEPDKKMSKSLAEHWIRKAGVSDADLLARAEQQTRGAFLKTLYERMSR
jgi:hypothetical protein